MKNPCQLAKYMFPIQRRAASSLQMPAKKGEHSQTVHYSGFLDMAAQTAWPHSTLKKKEQSLSVSIIPFDLNMHTFFFYL